VHCVLLYEYSIVCIYTVHKMELTVGALSTIVRVQYCLYLYSTQDGADCLHAAVENHLVSVVDMLCQKGAVIDKLDRSGESVLWHALSTEQYDIADTLVSKGKQ